MYTNGDLMEGATLNKEVDYPDFADKDHAMLNNKRVSKQVNYWLYGTATEIN